MPAYSRLEPRLRELAAHNGGLLTHQAAREAGLGREELRFALGRRRWVRLHRGVYVPADVERSPLLVARAAVAAVKVREAAASHHTAAAVHGLPLARASPVEHVTVLRVDRRPHRPDLRVHAHQVLAQDLVPSEGVPMTGPDRTAYDLLLDADELTAIWACEAGIRRGVISGAGLRQRLAEAVRVPGSRRARARFGLAEPASESPLETGARLVLVAGGLPVPRVQFPVTAEDGTVLYRIDLAYEERRVAVETDGQAAHDEPAALYRDRWRQNELVRRGWLLLRFTWQDVFDRPAYLVRSVRRALAESRYAA
jgi:hypothetical protein